MPLFLIQIDRKYASRASDEEPADSFASQLALDVFEKLKPVLLSRLPHFTADDIAMEADYYPKLARKNRLPIEVTIRAINTAKWKGKAEAVQQACNDALLELLKARGLTKGKPKHIWTGSVEILLAPGSYGTTTEAEARAEAE